VERGRKQREAVEAIEALGGQVYYEYQSSGGQEPPGPKWLWELIGEEYFVSVVSVFLSNPLVTDVVLEHLKGLTNLQVLGLSTTQITDAGLEHLKGLKKLGWLLLDNTQVTDNGVKKLQQALPNVVHLKLQD